MTSDNTRLPTILLTGDNQKLPGTLEKIFRQEGYETILAFGIEALSQLIQERNPDISIVDSDSSPAQTLQTVQSIRLSSVSPIIVLSSREAALSLRKTLPPDVDLITKPFAMRALLSSVAKRDKKTGPAAAMGTKTGTNLK